MWEPRAHHISLEEWVLLLSGENTEMLLVWSARISLAHHQSRMQGSSSA
jgi:hypothetical protein